MSAAIPVIKDCCETCDPPTCPEIPGPQGEAGIGGTDGTNGINAFTITISGFTMPAVGDTVTLDVEESSWASPNGTLIDGQYVHVQSAGYFFVDSLPSSTQITLNNTGATGNAAPGTIIPDTQKVSPAGIAGPAGSNGAGGAQGPQGNVGATGATGATGPQGPQGNPGVGAAYALFRVHKTSDQSITQAATTQLTWQAEDFDPDGVFAGNQFVAPQNGYYFFACAVNFNGEGAIAEYEYYLDIAVNGAVSIADQRTGPTGIGPGQYTRSISVSGLIQLSLNDVVIARFRQEAANPANVVGTASLSYFCGWGVG